MLPPGNHHFGRENRRDIIWIFRDKDDVKKFEAEEENDKNWEALI